MNKLFTKILLVGALLALVFVLAPKEQVLAQDSNQTLIADLQRQIANLQQRLAELQAQLKALRGGERIEIITFTKTLYRGLSDDEVANLQLALSSDVAIYPEGLVTGYFGSLTEAAVKRFQARYGIEQVGIVGPKTRAQLNQVFGTLTLSGSGGTSSEPSAPVIFIISPNGGEAGTKITLNGSNFDAQGNTVNFGSTKITNLVSGDGETLTFNAPSVSAGTHNVSVTNAQGTSLSVKFTVGSGSKATITIVSPNGGESFVIGDTVVIDWSVSPSEFQQDYPILVSLTDGPTNGIISLPELAAQASQFSWKIPATISDGSDSVILKPGNYKIQISLYDKTLCLVETICPGGSPLTLLAEDTSDESFTIK